MDTEATSRGPHPHELLIGLAGLLALLDPAHLALQLLTSSACLAGSGLCCLRLAEPDGHDLSARLTLIGLGLALSARGLWSAVSLCLL